MDDTSTDEGREPRLSMPLEDFCVIGCGPEQSIQVREAVLRHFRRVLNGGRDPKGHPGDTNQIPQIFSTAHVFLSTCDRVEIYLAQHDAETLDRFTLPEQAGIDGALFLLKGEVALRHLFRVASGLESPLLGENQILGQVRDAYEAMRMTGTLDSLSHRLFQAAIAAGRNVRNVSGLNRGAVSHGQAVQSMLSRESLIGPQFKYVFVGANPMLETILKYLTVHGSGAVLVGNRSLERAEELAGKYKATVFGLDQLQKALSDADVLISATSAPHHIVTLNHLLQRNPEKPLRVFDLAVPRDIDPAVSASYRVRISTVSDIEDAVTLAIENRRLKLSSAEAELERQLRLFRESELRRNARSV